MSSKHLRIQAGGNPAQGPHPDVANPTPSPAAGEDFPDRPDEHPADRPQDRPDLDAFAERMGTDRLGERSDSPDGPSASELVRNWRQPVSAAFGGLATGARALGERLTGVSERLLPGDDAEPDLAALRERVAKVRTAMVTSVDERGTLSSRPLTVAEISESGDVHFVVDRDADWVSSTIGAVNVALVDGSNTWISVAGRGVVDDDAQRLDDLWSPVLDTFFPEGRDRAAVLSVHADRWEYWTAPDKLTQLVEIVRARVGDDRPDLGRSGTVPTER